jgi:uracil-DNA glycosylase
MKSWDHILKPFLEGEKGIALKTKIKELRTSAKVFPESPKVFRCFDTCPFDKIRLVIVGDEPYRKENFSDGLAFSTTKNERPPKLEKLFRNIYMNLYEDYQTIDKAKEFSELFPSNDLTLWSEQGVLLLNSAFTCQEDKVGSHYDLWSDFTAYIITELAKKGNIAFIFWGDNAMKFNPIFANNYCNKDWGEESNCWKEAMYYLSANNKLDRFEYNFADFVDFEGIYANYTETYKELMSEKLFNKLKEHLQSTQTSLITQLNINLTTNKKTLWQ